MPWFKVKSLNYIPSFRGMENLIVSAIVEFGMTVDGVDQPAFAKEVDLLKTASFEGNYLPLSVLDAEQASAFVTSIVGEDEINHLKLKAEIALLNNETLFLSL